MSGISKLDYLKRYMDNGSDNSKKLKKKKKKVKRPMNNIKIVDSDLGFIDAKVDSDAEDDYSLQEEKPILFAEDGATVITKEFHEQEEKKKKKWAPIKYDTQKPSRRHDSSDSDMSPARSTQVSDTKAITRRQRGSSSDLSPERTDRKSIKVSKRRRHDSSDSDLSPERSNLNKSSSRKRHDSSDSDLSPGRRKNVNASTDSDMSPPRKQKNNSDEDMSPVRQQTNKKISKHQNKHETEAPEILSTGKKSGLQTSAQLREENERKRIMERQLLNDMDESISGKGAETVHRDRKTGKKVDIKFEEFKEKRELEDKLKETEKYARWGKGVAQSEDREQKLQDDLLEMEKPLARYKDDADLDNLLRKQVRDGDPMLAYLTKKKEKKSNQPSKPKYRGPPPPPNRFNIIPGYRYDGVDRSNGFEKKRFMAINKQKSFETDKYKWSVEDM